MLRVCGRVGFVDDGSTDRSFELLVGGTAADQRPQVVASYREKAGEELPFGGKPNGWDA